MNFRLFFSVMLKVFVVVLLNNMIYRFALRDISAM